MDETNRVPQRTRPRPYDLRRKVLLKNFLREQMTHIPLPPPRMPMEALEDDPVVEEEDPSSSVGNEENIEQPNNKQLSVSSSSATEPVPSSSEEIISDEIPTESPEPETKPVKTAQPTFSRLSSLLRTKINSVRKRDRITKAKLKLKAKGPAQLGTIRTTNKTDNDHSSKGKKSFFAMFKTRRNNKRKAANSKQEAQTSNPVTETKSSTSNQSVQTDASFTQEEYNNMEQSNRCLLEENRLLSESLSSMMMSDYKYQMSPLKIPYGTDSYITSSGISPVANTSQQASVDVGKQTDSQAKNDLKVKIPRSKSMQERFDKRTPYRPRLRARSMNYGLSKRFYDSSSLSPREPPPYRRGYATDQVHRQSPRRGKYKTNSFSTFDTYSRQGISVPASDANARMLPPRASVLKNLPINNSNRAIIRRSSMPERTSYYPPRPVLRHKSTRVAGYNRVDAYDVEHNNYNYNGNMLMRRRSNGGDYARAVPFRNLPPEAFY